MLELIDRLIAESYPEDEATGFEVGDLQGWMWDVLQSSKFGLSRFDQACVRKPSSDTDARLHEELCNRPVGLSPFLPVATPHTCSQT